MIGLLDKISEFDNHDNDFTAQMSEYEEILRQLDQSKKFSGIKEYPPEYINQTRSVIKSNLNQNSTMSEDYHHNSSAKRVF